MTTMVLIQIKLYLSRSGVFLQGPCINLKSQSQQKSFPSHYK